MFKRFDYIVIALICFFLGIFIISQFYAGKSYTKVLQPENNAVLAIEVSKLTRTNADLRREVQDLTSNLDVYKTSSESRKAAYDQYLGDMERFGIINGEKPASGQGVLITVDGVMQTAQIVDLTNALKNIGAEIIEINGIRVVLNTDLSQFKGSNHYSIKVLGNSSLLKSAMERKGGIIEQISTNNIKFTVESQEKLDIGTGQAFHLNYSRVVD